MNFWKKRYEKNLNSDEYEKLTKKLIEISARVEELQNQNKILETNYNNLRGNFNRKLSGLKKEEEEETQDINNQVILPYNGIFR